VLALVQQAEAAGDYDAKPEATAARAADERVHALVVAGLAQRQRARASGWFRGRNRFDAHRIHPIGRV